MLTVQRKVQCVLWLARFKSVILVQREYRRVYKENPPHRNNIRRWDKKFKETGSLLDKKRSGRPTLSEESVQRIRESYLSNPKKSVRECARELGLSKSSVHKVLSYIQATAYEEEEEKNSEVMDDMDAAAMPKWTHFLHQQN